MKMACKINVMVIMSKILSTLVVIMLLVMAGNAFAGTRSAVVNVSTRVVTTLRYQALHQERNLIITEHDIERGYVDISNGLVLSIRTNSKNGYVLWFSVNNSLLRDVTVVSAKNTYRLSQSGYEVHMPHHGRSYFTEKLSFRLHLSPNAKPGMHPWPFAIMVSAM